MKIVKFQNGSYGIRKWSFGYQYKDLKDHFWWSLQSNHFKDCQGTIAQVLDVFKQKKDKGVPVRLEDLLP